MNAESAVEFPTPTRIHVALAVRDVARAAEFYRALLGQEPTKVRPGYAKFEVIDPPLNLALNETPAAVAPSLPQHFGIQVQQHAAIGEIEGRLTNAGFIGTPEDQVTCCYAVQDKVWVDDPDGHSWELFIVTDADAAVHSANRRKNADPSSAPSEDKTAATTAASAEAPCCAPSCCT